MILYVLLFVLSVPMYSYGKPYYGGSVSRAFLDNLRRQAEPQRGWNRNLIKQPKILRRIGNGHRQGQVSYGNSIRKEYLSTRNQKPAHSPEYLSQNNYGFINLAENQIARDAKFQGSRNETQRESFNRTRYAKSGHPAFNIPTYRTGEARESEYKGKQALIVKVGGHEIRIRPEDYEIGHRGSEFKSGELTEYIPLSPFTPPVNEPQSVTPNAQTYFSASSSNKESFSTSTSEEPYLASELPTSTSLDETVYSQHSDCNGQLDCYQLVDYQSRDTPDTGNRSLPIKPKHPEENITQESSFSMQGKSRDLNDKEFRAHGKWREVIINGQLQGKNGGKGNISEHSFPLSISAAEETSNLQSETSEEPWKLFPPLLIEEIDLPNVKDYESPESLKHLNVSQRMLPGEAVTDRTGSKITTLSSEKETGSLHELSISDFFQIPNTSDGSGDRESAEDEHSSVVTDFLNVDAVEELIADRKINLDSSQTPFLEQAGSGLGSLEAPSRDISPRIVDFFAKPNDSSTPCTTPKGEPGHCRDIRYCMLQEVLNNFNLYLQYVCLIRRRFVGVCCPDNPVISHTPEPDEENSTESTSTQIMEFSQPIKGCGVNKQTRIVGGSVSQPHEWSWMVALLRKNRFFCGGVLLNDWYVLTAAHCTLGINPRVLKIRLGEYNFLESREHQEDISVQEIKRHAQFITLTFRHDIALLKLKRPVQFSRFVSSICLPQADEKYRDTNATVVGWGAVSFGGAASPVLREVTLPVWKNEECDRTYLLEDMNDSFLCAGSPEPNQDACQGDSGGPLMALNGDGRWEAIGIVSWGRRCGDPKYPGVYTRITTYLDWIQKNMI